jgi:hypothetical protein
MKSSFILTGNTFTGVVKGKPFTINKGHRKFDEVTEAWRARDIEKVERLIDGIRIVENFTMGNIKVLHGQLTYKGEPISNALAERVVEMMEASLPYEPVVRFADNLMQNPSQSARDELFLFLNKGKMPITEDGHFLAYRKVDENYKSYHRNGNGTQNSNKPGEVVEMSRAECDDNRGQTCSAGLHFCSYSYLPHYEGNRGKVVIVKINPRDVVSIPNDYDDAKGRCCRYEVIEEHRFGQNKDSLAGALAIVKEETLAGEGFLMKTRKLVKAVFGAFKRTKDGKFKKK